jgi:hypothetical protein
MKKVRYRYASSGTSRRLRVADLDALGIDHKQDEDLVFNQANKFTIEMNNKASDSLVAALPKEFAVVGEDEDDEFEVPAPMTSIAQSGSGEPQGDPNWSHPDEIDPDASSGDDES